MASIGASAQFFVVAWGPLVALAGFTRLATVTPQTVGRGRLVRRAELSGLARYATGCESTLNWKRNESRIALPLRMFMSWNDGPETRTKPMFAYDLLPARCWRDFTWRDW